MRAVVQRVESANVIISDKINGEIGVGLVILLGVITGDTEKEADILAKKIAELRIFKDENDKMNLSANDLNCDVLVISNFTLGADCSHGRRPYFVNAAQPDTANTLYEYFMNQIKKQNVKKVASGVFGADMKLSLVNDGPVTIVLDTDELGGKKQKQS